MKIKGRTIDGSFMNNASLEEVPCRLCDSRTAKILSRRDCLGLPVRTVMCRQCGLIFINPRPTKEWYKSFYSSVGGYQHEYKDSRYTDESKPIGWGFEHARRHGQALARLFGRHMKTGTTIDVGSSEGGVLAGIREVTDIQPIGIEPVPAEAEYATRYGIPTYAALIENIESLSITLPPADNVICVKSLNHFLDPAYFFSWAWRTLRDDGRILLEVKNFRQQARRSGRIYTGIQLDHPYMYTPETLLALVRRAGFEVLFIDVDEGKSGEEIELQRETGLPVSHVRLAAKKTSRKPFAAPFTPEGDAAQNAEWTRPINLFLYYLINHANIRKNLFSRFGMS